MHRLLGRLITISAIAVITSVCVAEAPEVMDLSGQWAFVLDKSNSGIERQFYLNRLQDSIDLPGTVDKAGLGVPQQPQLYRLTKSSEYVGPAWYQRHITIPDDWKERKITLELERCHWQTTVWVNENQAGSSNSLVAPHRYDLTEFLSPGEHTLTICVDNRHIIDIGQWSASVTDESQTNWNGIIGKIAIYAQKAISVSDLQIYPDYHSRKIEVKMEIDNSTKSKAAGDIAFRVYSNPCKERFELKVKKTGIRFPRGQHKFSFEIPLGEDAPAWSEFDPHLLRCDVTVKAATPDRKYTVSMGENFGLRSIETDKTKFLVNGRKIFLRGTVDAAQFPITGHPPMDISDWIDYFENYRRYGLNHIRFHSWCPPKAAFQAADKVGFYLQVEAPFWLPADRIENCSAKQDFMRAEVYRILAEYGNHPSFMFITFGNELFPEGQPFFEELVQAVKQKDRRRLCAASTRFELTGEDDFFHTVLVGGKYVRGQGRIGLTPFDSVHDYKDPIQSLDRPVLVHEAGQYSMYPDFEEIDQYTGVLRPKNLIAYRHSLKQSGMLNMAEQFKDASGQLMLALYKEEMEAALRTPNLGGIQLLGLTDFHGWGTAVIGPLNALHKSKGLITEERFREFCNSTVVLLRIEKPTWSTSEIFFAAAEVAHWGEQSLGKRQLQWKIEDTEGKEILSRQLDAQYIESGGNTVFGDFSFELNRLDAPARYDVVLKIDDTPYQNRWPIWVYPPLEDVTVPPAIIKTSAWNNEIKAMLTAGKKVLLMLDTDTQYRNSKSIRFAPAFWSAGLFANQPDTHGIYCHSGHPALSLFPTDSHSHWQWFDLLHNAQAVIIDRLLLESQPIVQPIDTFFRNNKLAALFEVKVEAGKLLVSTLNTEAEIDNDSLACRQLLHSLINYMQSQAFAPSCEVTLDQLDALFEIRQKSPVAETPPVQSDDVRLHIRAASALDDIAEKPWHKTHDQIESQCPGFDYSIEADSFKHYALSSWKARHLRIHISCPEEFTGNLYVLFTDWDARGRSQALYLEGRDLGPLDVDAREGFWRRFDISTQDTLNGRIVFEARTLAGPNTLIAEMVLIEQ